MGRDPKAMLFYGIAYDDGELPEDLSEKAWDYEHAQKDAAVPQPGEFDVDREHRDPAWAALWNKWREDVQKWEREQCDTRSRGYCDEPKSCVYVVASMQSVEWDETAEVASLDVPPSWEPKLRAYCEAMGIPWREPKWLLAAYYG